ncbi:MAG: LamG domain-containing protein [Nanoarchaeota archaeon]
MRQTLHLTFLLVLLVILVLLGTTLAEAANATVVYRSNTGSCASNALNCPKIRAWDSTGGGSWGSAVELPTAGSPVRYAVIRFSNVSSKRALVTSSDDGFLDGYVSYNNTAWTVTNNIGQVFGSNAAKNERRFDLQFETASGDAVLTYATTNSSGNCDLAYKVLLANDTSWANSGETCIDNDQRTQDDQSSYINMDRNPSDDSSEMVMANLNTNLSDVTARVWDGDNWGNRMNITTTSSITTTESQDVAYAKDGSKAMVVAGDGVNGNVTTKYWNGASWTTTPGFDIDTGDALDLKWIHLKADSLTDDLQAVFVDSGSDLGTAYWNGATWAVTRNIDTAVDSNAARPSDFAWNSTNSGGKLVLDTDTTGTTLSQRGCTPQCTSGTTTFSTYAATGAWLNLYRVPYDPLTKVSILGLRLNSAFDLGSFAQGINGSYYTYGDNTLTADTTVTTFEPYSLAFQTAYGGYSAPSTVYTLNQSAFIKLDNKTTDWGNLTILTDTAGDQAAGGSSFDITNISLANGPTRLFAYLQLAGGVNYSANNYYRIFVTNNEDNGKPTAPDTGILLPFKYTHVIQLNNSKCRVFNNTGGKVGNCQYYSNNNTLEIEVPFKYLNVTKGESLNVTFETGNWTNRYDLAPYNSGYIQFLINQTKYETYNFTNNTYANYSTDDPHPSNGSFSAELWVRTPVTADQMFISSGEYDSMEYYWRIGMISAHTGILSIKMQDGIEGGEWWEIPDPGAESGQIIGSSSLSDNQWHHIAFVRDREQMRVYGYVDGVPEINFSDSSRNVTSNASNLVLGKSNIYADPGLVGNLSVIGTYNRALTTEEVQDHNLTQREEIEGET